MKTREERRNLTLGLQVRTWLVSALDHRYAVPAIILGGVMLRLIVLAQLAPKGLLSDAASYNTMASQLHSGERFIPFWPPGVPLYLASIRGLFGSEQWISRASMLVFYVGLSIAISRLVFFLTSRGWASSVAVTFLAFAPAFILASLETTTELPTAMLLAALTLMLVNEETSESFARYWSIGIVLGCLVLVRSANVVLLVPVPLFLFFRKKSFLALTPVVVMPLAIVACWIGFVAHQTGRVVMINTSNAKNLYLGNSERTPLYRTWWLGSHHDAHEMLPSGADPQKMDPIVLNAEYGRLAASAISQHPFLFVLRTFNRICVYLALDTFTGAYVIESYGYPKLLGFCIIALDALVYAAAVFGSICFVATQRGGIRSAGAPWVILAVVLLYAVPYFISFSHPRYHFPTLPLLLALSVSFAAKIIGEERALIRELIVLRMRWVVAAFAVFSFVQLEFVYVVSKHLN